MRQNEGPVGDLRKSVAAEALPVSGTLSRIIEFFPPGSTVTGRDCMYGSAFSKGARVIMADNAVYECTGDENGSWKKVSK
jgi:hypothetical protein